MSAIHHERLVDSPPSVRSEKSSVFRADGGDDGGIDRTSA